MKHIFSHKSVTENINKPSKLDMTSLGTERHKRNIRYAHRTVKLLLRAFMLWNMRYFNDAQASVYALCKTHFRTLLRDISECTDLAINFPTDNVTCTWPNKFVRPLVAPPSPGGLLESSQYQAGTPFQSSSAVPLLFSCDYNKVGLAGYRMGEGSVVW